jgi:hypothetical protein
MCYRPRAGRLDGRDAGAGLCHGEMGYRRAPPRLDRPHYRSCTGRRENHPNAFVETHVAFCFRRRHLLDAGIDSAAHQSRAEIKTQRIGAGRNHRQEKHRYFASHGPATLQDFAWWSGLSASDARRALETVRGRLISETFHAQTLWFTEGASKTDTESVYLLPAFDEFIISYKDRRAALPLENHNKAVSNNGIFRPVVVVNGQVMGIWKRTIKKSTVVVETELFSPPDKTNESLIEQAAVRYGHFLDKKTETSHTF